MLLYLDFSFSSIHEKDKKLGILNISLGCTFKCFPNFFQIFLKSSEIRIFEVPLISYFVRLCGQSFRDIVFVTEIVKPSLLINYQFSRKRNVHIYITILCQVSLSAANTVKSCKHPALLGFFPISNISPFIDLCSFFIESVLIF